MSHGKTNFIIFQTFFFQFGKLQFFPIFYSPLCYAVVVNNVLCTRIGLETRVQFKMVPSARACYIFYICKCMYVLAIFCCTLHSGQKIEKWSNKDMYVYFELLAKINVFFFEKKILHRDSSFRKAIQNC